MARLSTILFLYVFGKLRHWREPAGWMIRHLRFLNGSVCRKQRLQPVAPSMRPEGGLLKALWRRNNQHSMHSKAQISFGSLIATNVLRSLMEETGQLVMRAQLMMSAWDHAIGCMILTMRLIIRFGVR